MNFRRLVIVLAALALFTSLASAAPIPVQSTLTCQVAAVASPTVRAEGIVEQVGDVTLTCTGGPTPVGDATDIGFVTIKVDYGVPVTSKTVGSGVEAVLSIDEPTAFVPCTAATNTAAPTVVGVGVTALCPLGATTAGGTLDANAANLYQGKVNTTLAPNVVEFDYIPVQALPANTQHIFRIMNVRVTPNGTAPVTATVSFTSVNGSTSGTSLVGLTPGTGNPATVATPAAGLVSSVSAQGVSICNTTNLLGSTGSPNMAILTFKEGFASAFKPLDMSSKSADINSLLPGSKKVGAVTYNKYQGEGGFQSGIAGIGVANSPTRVKAIFTGLDKNITYYVSLKNVDAYNAESATTKALLLSQAPAPGTAMELQAAGSNAGSDGNANGTVAVAKLAVSATGTATAVWEIQNAIDATNIDSLSFALYGVFNTNTPPTPTTAPTVQMGFAPTTGATGDAATWIPRFSAPPAAVAGAPILTCQTSLLFPYLTNFSGWETGVAISNTGKDPFNTTGSTGDCKFNFYGTNAPSTVISFATAMAPGSTVANTLSNLGLVNFSGYGVAVCGFQYAHGFAFVNNSTATMAVGYLASVMEGSNRGLSLLGESFGQ